MTTRSSTPTLRLPRPDGSLEEYTMRPATQWSPPTTPPKSRIAFAAAHVIADPFADNTPGQPAALDWEATLAFRRHLWSYGLGVADAMDTAQRGMGLDWAAARELITRVGAEAAACGGRLACGAGTDHASPELSSLAAVEAAYLEQIEVVQNAGAQVIIMASRQLARLARGPEDYLKIYDTLLGQLDRPAILHWLGPMFDPALEGYWGSSDLEVASQTLVELVRTHASRVDGVKVSLLDADREIALRRAFPPGVKLYTGDDFNYPTLIAGDEHGYSDALLGVFDPIAPIASAALTALDAGDRQRYDELFAPTLPLARHLFGAPTYHYKTGVVFLAWLTGHQSHFTMVNGAHSARSIPHLCTLFRLADAAGLFSDPEQAAYRMSALLTTAGVEQ